MDDEEQIKRAIKLSLEDTHARPRTPVCEDMSDSGDESAAFEADLERAIEASKAEAAFIASSFSEVSRTSEASSSSFLSERAQLEKARLERQKRQLKSRLSESIEADRPTKIQRQAASSAVHDEGAASSSNSQLRARDDSVDGQTFWTGALRQTACRFSEPRKDGRPTFRLTEILGRKEDLEFAILSSYALDLPWIYSFFNPSVPVIIVGSTGEERMRYVFPTWVYVKPLLRGDRGCMHMKFMLLFYKSRRLRIVVSTANLVDFDWRDIENTVWLQDIPNRAKPIDIDKVGTEDFASVMGNILQGLGVQPALELIRREHSHVPIANVNALQTTYDFSKVSVQLIPSMAGRHEGWPAVLRTGHTRFMKAIRSIDARRSGSKAKGQQLVIECQGSSIGQYSTQWLNEFYHSAQGESAEDWLDQPKSRRVKLPFPPMQVVFPTKTTVQVTTLGEPGGGTIFCSRRQWDAAKFPRELFHDSESKGGPVLMHSKMIIGIFRKSPTSPFSKNNDTDTESEDDDEVELIENLGWAYVGSHNFTPSAWGNLSGSAFNPVMNNVNYELGILFPLKDEPAVGRVACYERPARKYTKNDRPWMQEESSVFRGA